MSELSRQEKVGELAHQESVPQPLSPRNPLNMIPEDWRRPVSWFAMAFAASFPNLRPSLCALLATWNKSEAMTTEEIVGILRTLLKPESVGTHKAPWDLIGALGAKVAELQQRKKTLREQLERRRQAEADRRGAVDAPMGGEFSKLIQDLTERAKEQNS